jgi:hypothetical protein
VDILMDIDGLSVGELRKFLDSYSDDDVLDVREELYRSSMIGGVAGEERVELHIVESGKG